MPGPELMNAQISSQPIRRRPLPVRARRALVAALIATGVLYGMALAALFFAQRTMLYPGSSPGAQAAAIVVPGAQLVALSTPDGEHLSAWHVAPESGRPVVLFLHGNGGALDAQTRRWLRMREAGAGLLAVSYRGYPGSTGRPTESGLHIDARTAFDWLRARYPAERIVIHGASLGTGLALRLASEVAVGAVLLEAPFTAVVDVAAERYPIFPVHALMIDQYRSRDWIARVTAPVLIAHGDRDNTVPFAHAERLYALANEPKLLVRMPGSDHNSLVRDGLYSHVWPFLERHQRPAPQQ